MKQHQWKVVWTNGDFRLASNGSEEIRFERKMKDWTGNVYWGAWETNSPNNWALGLIASNLYGEMEGGEKK